MLYGFGQMLGEMSPQDCFHQDTHAQEPSKILLTAWNAEENLSLNLNLSSYLKGIIDATCADLC